MEACTLCGEPRGSPSHRGCCWVCTARCLATEPSVNSTHGLMVLEEGGGNVTVEIWRNAYFSHVKLTDPSAGRAGIRSQLFVL